MRHFLIAILVFSGMSVQAFRSDTTWVRASLEQARALSALKKNEAALKLAILAQKKLAEMAHRPLELETGLYNVLGDCDLELGNYAAAIRNYENSTQILQRAGQENGLLMAEVLNKTGNYFLEIQDFEQAKTRLDQALDIRIKKLGNRHHKVAEVYNNLGNYWYFTGDYDKALEFHYQALAIRLEQSDRFQAQIAQSYDNIGLNLEKKNQKEAALDIYQLAIEIYTGLGMQRALAGVYNNISSVYGELGYPDFFLEYQNRALNIWQKTLDNNHPSIALCYNNLAIYYTSYPGDYRRADQLHRRALAIRLHNYGPVHPDVAATYYNIGLNDYFNNDLPKAIDAYEQCLKALNYRPGAESAFDQVNDKGTLLQLFERLADAHIASYERSGQADQVLTAFSYIQQADQLIDFLRIRYEPKGSKLQLAADAHRIYGQAIELAAALNQLTGKESYLHEAFAFSEKSKGTLLLEALKKTEAETFSGIPPEVISRIRQLEGAINSLEKKRFIELNRNRSVTNKVTDSLDHQIFEQKQRLSDRIDAIERDYPAYYSLRYETKTVPIDWIQKKLLKPGQTALEYFLSAGRLQIFVINPDHFVVRSFDIDEQFYDWLDQMISSIRQFPVVSSLAFSENIEQYVSTANLLYQTLIEPVKDLLAPHLVIIPDGELGFLPFEALLSGRPEDLLQFSAYPFLIRDYTVSYNYSSTLLKEMAERKAHRRLKPYLGLAPSFREGNIKGLSPLKYNREEVVRARKILGGRILEEKNATKARFLAQQSHYRILHLATHGKVDDAFGDYSYLAFSESGAVTGDEALLFVKEIFSLSTNAEMVVLSACDSGTGELQKGEGIASVARSFSYIGARSLVATQWSVDDEATKNLIHLFFKNIKKGFSKDIALRSAKLEFIASYGNKSAHPFYWASFVPIGNMDPIQPDSGKFVFLALGFVVLAFLLYFCTRRFRKKKT